MPLAEPTYDRRESLPATATGISASESGMTLIEVIAVIVLITLIAVAVGKNVFKTASAGKAKLNVTQMNTLKGYLGQFRLQFNVYPGKLDDLVHPSAAVKQTGELFTPFCDESSLKDVWGNPYIYAAENNGRSFLLKSLGEDATEGGEGAAQDVEMRP